MLHQQEFETFSRVGAEAPRAYYIPFGEAQEIPMTECGIQDRTASDRFIDLNGEWAFRAHESLDEANLNEQTADKIDVPSCVQMRGYDQNQYLNTRYPIPCDPPHVPKRNPVFHYRKRFSLERGDFRYFLNFEGVDSFFYLFLNGERVGYSQISHATSEFEITGFLRDGENTLDVFVLKWSAGTYLECQDKFRFSGIFRSVYILKRPRAFLRDFKLTAGADGVLTVRNLGEIPFTASFDGESKVVDVGGEVKFVKKDAQLWTAERPVLYDVILSAEGEKILQRVGFRSSEVKNGVYLLNGKPIKLKGVNRHEFSPENGATVTVAETVRDFKLMKEAHVNAIRTCHYPDCPEFGELCDVYGFYVVDEADVETHGMTTRDGGYSRERWQEFANSGIADEGVTTREITLYERDKNRTSVVIWSLGNEANWGKMFYAGADYIHAHDTRPIHYEGAWEAVDRSDYYTHRIDIASRMYPPLEFFDEFLKDEKETRPLLLCEYSHAMGNSNGDLNDYWKKIDSSDRFAGAFVWEWRDHAIKSEKGYLYGGDSGEAIHDGNFCVDGLLNPDWTPKSGYYEMQAVYGGAREQEAQLPNAEPLAPVGGEPITYQADENGALLSLGGVKFAEPLQVNVLRAYLDNDMYRRNSWKNAEGAMTVVEAIERTKNRLHVFGKLEKDSFSSFAEYELDYTFFEGGVDIEFSYRLGISFLPRAGLRFALKGVKEFTYCGYGPYESYIDKHLASEYGEYRTAVEREYFHYVKPQESGSHFSATKIELDNGMTITAEKPFSFSILPYSLEQLISARHDFELPESDAAYISLDIAMCGVGTSSCGPELAEPYRIAKEGTNNFRILCSLNFLQSKKFS